VADNGITLSELFNLPEARNFLERALPDIKAELMETHSAISTSLLYRTLDRDLYKKMVETLSYNPMELIEASWENAGVLRDLGEYGGSEGETIVALADHTVVCELFPSFDIRGGNIKARIALDVIVEFKLIGLVLRIENGRVSAVQAGSCEGVGVIKAGGVTLLEHQFGPIDMPSRFRLANGVPLRQRLNIQKSASPSASASGRGEGI
jgi:hypothetical protein